MRVGLAVGNGVNQVSDAQSVASGARSGVVSVIAFLGGFGAKWLLDLEQNRRLTVREREERREARRDLLTQRRADFQQKNLLDLQEACTRLIRKAGQANHHDKMTLKKTGEWQKGLLPKEVDEEFRLGQATVLMLEVRVRDSEIRDLTKELRTRCTSVVISSDVAASDKALDQMAITHGELNHRIGAVLRDLEDSEISALSK
jgi:hypothetical protein